MSETSAVEQTSSSTPDSIAVTNTDTQQFTVSSVELNPSKNSDVQPSDSQQSASLNQEEVTQPEGQQIEELKERVEHNIKTMNSVKQDLKTKGVDLNQAIKEYTEYGGLSTQTMADLAQAGYPKEVIEEFIASRQVLERAFTAEVYRMAGGEQEYNTTIQWAQHNLPQSVIEHFNRAIDGNNLEAIHLMLDGMKARRTATMGTRNPTLMGGASNKTAPKGFTSRQEMIDAMSDPRYYKDATYNREVTQKLLNSSIF